MDTSQAQNWSDSNSEATRSTDGAAAVAMPLATDEGGMKGPEAVGGGTPWILIFAALAVISMPLFVVYVKLFPSDHDVAMGKHMMFQKEMQKRDMDLLVGENRMWTDAQASVVAFTGPDTKDFKPQPCVVQKLKDQREANNKSIARDKDVMYALLRRLENDDASVELPPPLDVSKLQRYSFEKAYSECGGR